MKKYRNYTVIIGGQTVATIVADEVRTGEESNPYVTDMRTLFFHRGYIVGIVRSTVCSWMEY